MKGERTESQGVEVTGETKARVMSSALKITLDRPVAGPDAAPRRPRSPIPVPGNGSTTDDRPIHAVPDAGRTGSGKARSAARQDTATTNIGEGAGKESTAADEALVREKEGTGSETAGLKKQGKKSDG